MAHSSERSTDGPPPPSPPGILAVIGAGTMGAGIAQVALEAGWSVRLHDPDRGALNRGRARIADGLSRRAVRRSMTAAETATSIDAHLVRLTEADDLAEATRGADLVIEAIFEDLDAKRVLFSAMDAVCPPGTILATNTSALSVEAIAKAAARHPERVLGLHFFNPAPVMLLVEVIAPAGVSAAVVDRATDAIRGWGRTPVRSIDSPGFIVNRVNRPFTIEALRMLEIGEARVGEIDAALRTDGFPMGPFELMDLVGLDVNLAAAKGVWEGLGRPDRLRPSPIQEWLVKSGRLGRKTGVGFYRYNAGRDPVPDPLPPDVAPTARGRRELPETDIVGRIRASLLDEAILVRDAGVATEADIDMALWLGAGHPEGPFAWRRRHDLTIGS